MGRPASEGLPQREFLHTLRYAIDTARKYKSEEGVRKAVELARSQPRALRSRHILHNIGQDRLAWLEANGVSLPTLSHEYGHEIAGAPAIRMDITQVEVEK